MWHFLVMWQRDGYWKNWEIRNNNIIYPNIFLVNDNPSNFNPRPFLTGPPCSRSTALTFSPSQPFSLFNTLYILPEILFLPPRHSDLSWGVASLNSYWICAKRFAWTPALTLGTGMVRWGQESTCSLSSAFHSWETLSPFHSSIFPSAENR